MWMSGGRVIDKGIPQVLRGKSCPNATLTQNPLWTDMGSNPGQRIENAAILSLDTVHNVRAVGVQNCS